MITDGFPAILCWRTTRLFKISSVKSQKIFQLLLNRCLPDTFYEILWSCSWETRAYSRRSDRSKNHPFAIFCSTAHALQSVGFSQNPAKFLDFLHLETFYYSVCYCKKEKLWNWYRTNKLSLYRCHVCLFLFSSFCNLCARAKKLCSGALNIFFINWIWSQLNFFLHFRALGRVVEVVIARADIFATPLPQM